MKKTVTHIAAILFAAGSFLPNNATSQTIGGGINFTISVCTTGSAMSVGYGGEGQLGDSTHTNSMTPRTVHGLSNVIAISCGGAHTLALKNDGTVWSWGYNVYASLGLGAVGSDVDTATQIAGLTNVTAISAGGYHSLALKADGTVWSWGSNFGGEIGDGSVSVRGTPVHVTGISGIVAIAAGDVHSLALKSDGSLYAWGFNSDGRVGDGSTTNRFSPVLITSLTNVSKIAAGGFHSLAMKTDGTIWAWGKNDWGQLGDGTFTNHPTPMQITGLSGVSTLDAGESHSMALKSDGTVWAWGRNSQGQLGDGTTTARTTPVQLTSISGVNTISAGYEHSLALKSDGTAWAWGSDDQGQLGDGTTVNKTSPIQMSSFCTAAVAGIQNYVKDDLAINVYPNPSNGMVQVDLSQLKTASVKVFNMTGQEVYSEVLNSGVHELNLGQLSAGLYIIHVTSEGLSGSERLIIQK